MPAGFVHDHAQSLQQSSATFYFLCLVVAAFALTLRVARAVALRVV